MKLQELREQLKAADREHLEQALVLIYKQLPKAKKEETDPLVTEVLKGNDVKKVKETQTVDFEGMKDDIRLFIENAYAQNYFAPNRAVPKSMRPKWRFIMKRYIKDLESIPVGDPGFEEAAGLLKELYKVLCTACNEYLFSTDDPFRSVGIEQTDLLGAVLDRTFALGYTRERVREMLIMASTGGLDRETLYISLQYQLIHRLGTSDLKYMAIEEAKALVLKAEEALGRCKKYDSSKYSYEDHINKFCDLILIAGIELCEPEPEVEYYFKHARKRDKEVILYCVLTLVDSMAEDNRLWKWVYEYAVKMGVEPRSYIRQAYEELIKQEGGH